MLKLYRKFHKYKQYMYEHMARSHNKGAQKTLF